MVECMSFFHVARFCLVSRFNSKSLQRKQFKIARCNYYRYGQKRNYLHCYFNTDPISISAGHYRCVVRPKTNRNANDFNLTYIHAYRAQAKRRAKF